MIFDVLVVDFSVLGLAVDRLALNKLWDLPLLPKSSVESEKYDGCGTCRDQTLLLSFIIQVFGGKNKVSEEWSSQSTCQEGTN